MSWSGDWPNQQSNGQWWPPLAAWSGPVQGSNGQWDGPSRSWSYPHPFPGMGEFLGSANHIGGYTNDPGTWNNVQIMNWFSGQPRTYGRFGGYGSGRW